MDSCRWTKACVSLWTRACQSSCQVWMTAWFLWLSNCFSCLPVDCSIMLNVLLCQVHLPTCLTPLQLREPACSFCLLNLLDFNTVITRESSGETRCLVTIALPHPGWNYWDEYSYHIHSNWLMSLCFIALLIGRYKSTTQQYKYLLRSTTKIPRKTLTFNGCTDLCDFFYTLTAICSQPTPHKKDKVSTLSFYYSN